MVHNLRHVIFGAFIAALLAGQALANDRNFSLYAPPELVQSGVLKYLLPRFSLKTQVRITLVEDPAMADVRLGDQGRPVFDGLGQAWALAPDGAAHPGVQKFSQWIGSEVGRRTILGFEIDGVAPFSLPAPRAAARAEVRVDGDAVAGLSASRQHCGRCHVVVAAERMNAIGSTPSFFALRSLSDWEARFAAFFALNPHPSFTQVTGVTEPFAEDRPPPIVPITLSLEDLEAILAYVAALEAADLGAPLVHQ